MENMNEKLLNKMYISFCCSIIGLSVTTFCFAIAFKCKNRLSNDSDKKITDEEALPLYDEKWACSFYKGTVV